MGRLPADGNKWKCRFQRFEGPRRLPTVITADVDPLGALHHAGPLQDVVVGLPLHLVLQGAQLILRLGIGQIPCREGGVIKMQRRLPAGPRMKGSRYLLPARDLD